MTDTHGNNLPVELTSRDFADAADPFSLFAEWFGEAQSREPNDPNAMALGTVGADGMPSVRMVLMKDYDPRGFVFYTNLESRKGRDLIASGKAALLFHWKSLRRQVRIRGPVEQVGDAEADEYYRSRPRGSRIGAWASAQSRPLDGRATLEQAVRDYEAKFGEAEIPRPAHWSGFRVVPLAIEFWHDRPFRLHDRLEFTRSAVGEPWSKTRLYP